MPLPVLANPDAFNMVGKELSSYKEAIKRVRDKQITIQNNVNKVIMDFGLNESTKSLYKEYVKSNKKLDSVIKRAYAVLNAPKTMSYIATGLFMAGRGAYYASGMKKLGASNAEAAKYFAQTAIIGGGNSPQSFVFNLVAPFVAGYLGGKIGMKMIKSPTDLANKLNDLLEETRNYAQVFIGTAKAQHSME